MKLAIIGIICMMLSVGIAGNWLYNPFYAQSMDYQPIAHFPEGDEPDEIFHSNLTYIPSLEMHYIEWNYVWLEAPGHTPDTERVRIYVKNGSVHHVGLSIHYEWTDIYDFEVDGNRVHIHFAAVYHTPFTTPESLRSSTIGRAIPIAATMLIGISLVVIDVRRKKEKKSIFSFLKKK